MSRYDYQVIRDIRHVARKECANYADGICLPENVPCHVINPAYRTIHDGAVDCDWFLLAVLPMYPKLNTEVSHEIFRDEDQAGEGWKECTRCKKPFIPGSNRQRFCADCGKAAKSSRIREKQRRYRQRLKRSA